MSRFNFLASDSTHELMWDRAREFYNESRYNEALVMYLELLSHGLDADLAYEAGSCYYHLGQYTKAIPLLESSVQLNDRRFTAFKNLADCYQKTNNPQKAIYGYIRARGLKPDDTDCCFNLGKLYSAQNMIFESTYFYNKFLQYEKDKKSERYRSVNSGLNNGRSNADKFLSNASRAYFRKELTSAKDNYILALNNYPISYDANLNLARVYHDMNNHLEAIKYFIRALFLNNNDRKLYMHIAGEYSYIRDYTRAYCYIKRYIETLLSSPNQAEYLNAIKYLKSFEPHIKKDAIKPPVSLIENNKYYEAALEYENILILNPDNGDFKINTQLYESLSKPENTLSKLYNKTGNNLLHAGKPKEANKFFTRVMEISAQNSDEYKFAKAKLTNV